MPRLEVTPDELTFDISENETILTASLRNDISHLHACGGIGRCSTCRISITQGMANCVPPTQIEIELAEKIGLPDDIRLACQTMVTGDVSFRRLLLDDRDMQLSNQIGESASGAVGTSRNLSMMFADIRGFTPLTESLSAYDIMFIINRYFDIIGEVIFKNGGQINNYIGDAVFAIFGLDNRGDHTFRSVQAALEMLDAMDDFKPYLDKAYGRVFDIGIGIHYGEVIVGTVGSGKDKRVNIIGDAVNTASRIEAANKEADTRLLISEDAHELIKDRVVVEDYIRQKLRGTSQRITLYEISSVIGQTTAELDEGVKAYQGRNWLKTFPVTDLPDGEKKKFENGELNILLINLSDEIFALENSCPHMRLPLDLGQVTEGLSILCPFHDSEFCLKTGDVLRWCEDMPEIIPDDYVDLFRDIEPKPISTIPVHIENEFIWVAVDR